MKTSRWTFASDLRLSLAFPSTSPRRFRILFLFFLNYSKVRWMQSENLPYIEEIMFQANEKYTSILIKKVYAYSLGKRQMEE